MHLNKTPQLRFNDENGNDYPDWELKSISEIIKKFRLGGNYSNSEKVNSNPLIKMGNLRRGNINTEKLEYIDEEEELNKDDLIFEDDLFFNTRNTLDLVGKVAIWRSELPKAYYNSNLMYMKFDNNRFMNYRYNSFNGIKNLRRIATGTTSVAAIFTKDLMKIKFFIPKLSEQKKIALFLTSVDSKIEKLTRKKELLEEYKKGVMQKLFSKEIRFKDDDGNDYPDWELLKLGQITTKISIKNKENNHYPIYSINKLVGFNPQSEQFDGLSSTDRNYDISIYKVIEKNTFAYNPARINIGSIGYSGELNKIIISSLYVCFKTSNILNDNFAYNYFKSFMFIQLVNRYTEGGVRQYLFYNNFSQIKINLPSLQEQIKIAFFVRQIEKKIEHVSLQIDKTKQFKKGLLQQMFV